MTSRTNEVFLTANQRLRDQLEELSLSLDQSMSRSIQRQSSHRVDDKGMTTDYATHTKARAHDLSVLRKSLAYTKLEIAALKRQIGDANRINKMSAIENHIRLKSRQLVEIQHETDMAMKIIQRDSYYENEEPAAVWLQNTTTELHKKISEERAVLSGLRLKMRTLEECLDDKRDICMQLESKHKERHRYHHSDEYGDTDRLKRQLTAIHFAIEDDKSGAEKKLAQLDRMQKDLRAKLAMTS